MRCSIAAIVLLALVAAGCTTPKLSDGSAKESRLVVLQVVDEKVRIVLIDGDSPGMSLGTREAGYIRSGIQRVELTPGRHTALIRFQRGSTYAEKLLWFVGEPGEAYLARVHIVGYNIRFSIEEKRSGRSVGRRRRCSAQAGTCATVPAVMAEHGACGAH